MKQTDKTRMDRVQRADHRFALAAVALMGLLLILGVAARFVDDKPAAIAAPAAPVQAH